MTGKEFMRALANGEVDIVQVLLDLLARANAPYCVIGGLAVNFGLDEELLARESLDGVGH